MAITDNTLAAQTRAKAGTTSSAALRKSGRVPAVIYGHGSPPVPVSLDAKSFNELLHAGGKNHLLSLTLDGSPADTALVREIQRDPVSRHVVHVDLQRVSATEEIAASLPLATIGVADGVRNSGGVMDVILHTIDIKGPANALPPLIEADVSALGIHQHLTAGDLKLPPGLKLDIDPATIIVAIEPSRTEAQGAETAAPAAAEVPTIAESEPAGTD